VSCAAALAVLDVIERHSLVEHARVQGERLRSILGAHPLVDHVRGSGLLLGVALAQPLAAAVESSARAHGMILNAIGADVIRLAPPLILSDADVAFVAERWPRVLDGAAS